MLVIPPEVGRIFAALIRACGRIRGPAPPIRVEVKEGNLHLIWSSPEVTLVQRSSTDSPDGRAIITSDLLTQGTPIPPQAIEEALPELPERWSSPGSGFLQALHDCARMTAREASRYALTRIQIRGSTGQVIASDGRSALIIAGFRFPFADDLLIPALPLFGSPILVKEREIRIARTAKHLVLAVGSWQILLSIDHEGRYPDVVRIIPRQASTVAGIAETDAQYLRARIASLPGVEQEHRPVTVVLDGGVRIEGHDPTTKQSESIRLTESPSAGVRARIVLDRRLLLRALNLGCSSLRVAPEQPLLCEGGPITFLTLPRDQEFTTPIAPRHEPILPRRTIVKPEIKDPLPRDPGEPPDPLGEAEAIRTTLADLLTRANRLVSQLKSRKKEQRALTQVWSSLKALNLGPEGRS